ncbi:hypothetical protein D3C84_741420 [compost metagenome]
MSLAQAVRQPISCFHEAMTCSTGLSARPVRIEQAIIIPGVILPSIASSAPAPRISDCNVIRTKRPVPLITAARSEARVCISRMRKWLWYQRLLIDGSMPMASMTSALRRLLLAYWAEEREA